MKDWLRKVLRKPEAWLINILLYKRGELGMKVVRCISNKVNDYIAERDDEIDIQVWKLLFGEGDPACRLYKYTNIFDFVKCLW